MASELVQNVALSVCLSLRFGNKSIKERRLDHMA